ncbi:MAG: cytochrome C oxidase subunit IV family protein [Candidatus Binatia bacterium]|nr:cytochrome C oxidase subunit IV family protein [Candidatus Binatia bacterium]
MSHYVIPVSTYSRTFAKLIALTALTIAMALVDLGAWNTIAALTIAATKAGLVCFYFMGLRWANRLIRVSFVVSLAGVVILFGGVLNDDLTRRTKTYLPAETRGLVRDFRVQGLDGLIPRTPEAQTQEDESAVH